MEKIINIAVVAHVDVGKSTLVDALLAQSGVFRENEVVNDCIMDNNDLERERGITIYSKNCSVRYKDYKINIVDTPGHADFGGEVERIIKTVDTVILLVDAKEGPMPQTRFVLEQALNQNINPILFINKIDKLDARIEEVINMTFDLFCELNANDNQLDFPILYGIAKEGIARYNPSDENNDIVPLFETIINQVKPYSGNEDDPLQLQISSLEYDDYIGRLGVGRVTKGIVKSSQFVSVSKNDGSVYQTRIGKIFINEGIKKKEVSRARYGDIVIVNCPNISIGDTICDKDNLNPLPPIKIEKPTMTMNFLVNTSPFAGKSGKYLTNRHLKERLMKELEINVGLEVEELNVLDGYKVSGRGELHLSILIEKMRREGYELMVSKPQVIFREENDKKLEPFENVIISCPNEYVGTIINDISERKGILLSITNNENYTELKFNAPTRTLIQYRSSFITNTKGEGIMVRSFDSFKPYVGEVNNRKNGVLVSMEDGKAFAYSLFNLSDRGTMIIDAGTEVYKGMVIGICNRNNDLNVNPCKNKQLTNMRASGSDEALTLITPKKFSLEEALEFINDDEYVEVTPEAIRISKKILDEKKRYKDRNK